MGGCRPIPRNVIPFRFNNLPDLTVILILAKRIRLSNIMGKSAFLRAPGMCPARAKPPCHLGASSWSGPCGERQPAPADEVRKFPWTHFALVVSCTLATNSLPETVIVEELG